MPDLNQVLADAREKSAVLGHTGSSTVSSQFLDDLLEQIRDAAEDYLTWLSEDKAYLKSGLSYRTLRRRFRELLDCGLARYSAQGHREYRSCAIPPRPDVASAKAAALAGEQMRAAS